MKKFLCLAFVIALLTATALAESIDIGALSDDELLALKSSVDQTVFDKGLSEIEIEAGVYAVGATLQPGGYTFIAHGSDYVWVYLGVFNNEDDVWNDDRCITSYCLTNADQEFHLDLLEGQFLLVTIPGGSCTYRKK